MSAPARPLATFAVGFLLLDALLLAWIGLELKRPGLVWGGAVCAMAAVAVIIMWRRYRHMLDGLEVRRREMKAEAESLRELLKARHLHN